MSSALFLIIAMLLLCFQVVHADLAPDFTLTDVDGHSFSLSSFRGRVVVLDFFGTYCGPCRNEMPQLKTVGAEFGASVAIASISMYDHDTDDVLRQFRIDYGITWILARDTANVWQAYGGMGIPALYIIDQDGYIRNQYSGYTDSSVLIGEIDGLMSSLLEGDVNGDGKVDILDISIVARAFGSHLGDGTWNEAANLNGDGVIDILDIAIVARQFGKKESPLNLLLNPSVETDENTDGLPDHWERGGDGDVDAVHSWLDAGYTGNHSLEISVAYNASAAGSHLAGWHQSFGTQYRPLDIGSRYLFRFQYKSNARCYIYAGFWDNSGKWIEGQFLECEAAATWTLSQWLEFTVPESANTEAVGFYLRNSDAVQVPNAYVIGDDFELVRG